jgi:hypothetical protein
MITTIMAGFAFGYCITDIIINYLSNRRVNKFIKDLEDCL